MGEQKLPGNLRNFWRCYLSAILVCPLVFRADAFRTERHAAQAGKRQSGLPSLVFINPLVSQIALL